jgi:crossover junction endodeoxyribonuclease RusA
MTFTVVGIPAPQGSKRHVGKGIMVESSAKVRPWREAVKWAFLEAGGAKMEGPLTLYITFTLPRPKSLKKGVRWPARRPDLDKLLRSTMDALTEACAWGDDNQVVRISTCKEYADSSERPGAEIIIMQTEERDAEDAE